MARNLVAALEDTKIGPVECVSTLRLLEKDGESGAQQQLFDQAEAEIARLVGLWRGQDLGLWVTYHSYYKAPDLVGPRVAQALDLPYVQIESTRAKKRLGGPGTALQKPRMTRRMRPG